MRPMMKNMNKPFALKNANKPSALKNANKPSALKNANEPLASKKCQQINYINHTSVSEAYMLEQIEIYLEELEISLEETKILEEEKTFEEFKTPKEISIIEGLSHELLHRIMTFLSIGDIYRIAMTNHNLHNIITSDIYGKYQMFRQINNIVPNCIIEFSLPFKLMTIYDIVRGEFEHYFQLFVNISKNNIFEIWIRVSRHYPHNKFLIACENEISNEISIPLNCRMDWIKLYIFVIKLLCNRDYKQTIQIETDDLIDEDAIIFFNKINSISATITEMFNYLTIKKYELYNMREDVSSKYLYLSDLDIDQLEENSRSDESDDDDKYYYRRGYYRST